MSTENEIKPLNQPAVMKKFISVSMLTVICVFLFGILAIIADYFIQSCEWKCIIWFLFGMLCMASVGYFVRNFAVSGQSKLLRAYFKWHKEQGYVSHKDSDIDDFIASNCH